MEKLPANAYYVRSEDRYYLPNDEVPLGEFYHYSRIRLIKFIQTDWLGVQCIVPKP